MYRYGVIFSEKDIFNELRSSHPVLPFIQSYWNLPMLDFADFRYLFIEYLHIFKESSDLQINCFERLFFVLAEKWGQPEWKVVSPNVEYFLQKITVDLYLVTPEMFDGSKILSLINIGRIISLKPIISNLKVKDKILGNFYFLVETIYEKDENKEALTKIYSRIGRVFLNFFKEGNKNQLISNYYEKIQPILK